MVRGRPGERQTSPPGNHTDLGLDLKKVVDHRGVLSRMSGWVIVLTGSPIRHVQGVSMCRVDAQNEGQKQRRVRRLLL